MSQTRKCPKLTVRNKPSAEGKISVGANVEVELDGQKLGNVSFLKIEIKASKIAKVMMEMYVELDVDLNPGGLVESEPEPTDYTIKGRTLAIKTLSNYDPAVIAVKK